MKIVVRGTNWVGDAVMSIPALRELRRIFPKAHIALHTRSWADGIFQDADFLDEILTIEGSESNLRDVIAQSRILQAKKFDLAVLFPNSFASAMTARFGGIPRRFGYSRDARRLFLTDPVSIPGWKTKRHEVFYYLNLVAKIEERLLGSTTVMDREPSITLPVAEDRRRMARSFMETNGVGPSKRRVVLGVGSANSRAKRWPAENYAAVGDLLQREMDTDVILLGSKDETEISNEVCKLSRIKPIVLTGLTDLAMAAAILSECDLLISNDMGLAHLAPAVGTETIVIFGPTNADTTRPYSPIAHVIRRNVDCSPCMLRDCPIDHRCMTRVTVDEVFERARILLTDAALQKA